MHCSPRIDAHWSLLRRRPSLVVTRHSCAMAPRPLRRTAHQSIGPLFSMLPHTCRPVFRATFTFRAERFSRVGSRSCASRRAAVPRGEPLHSRQQRQLRYIYIYICAHESEKKKRRAKRAVKGTKQTRLKYFARDGKKHRRPPPVKSPSAVCSSRCRVSHCPSLRD